MKPAFIPTALQTDWQILWKSMSEPSGSQCKIRLHALVLTLAMDLWEIANSGGPGGGTVSDHEAHCLSVSGRRTRLSAALHHTLAALAALKPRMKMSQRSRFRKRCPTAGNDSGSRRFAGALELRVTHALDSCPCFHWSTRKLFPTLGN